MPEVTPTPPPCLPLLFRGPRADAERNRRHILDTALGLFRVNRSATMDDVVESSGLSRTTVFRHFKRRDDLLHAVFVEVANAVEQRFDAAPLEALDPLTGLRFICQTAVELADEFGVVLTFHGDTEVFGEALVRFERVTNRCVALCERAQAARLVRDDVSADWLANVFLGLSQALYECLVRGTMKVESAEDALYEQFVRGAQSGS
jgi:AcrR family transcriptional regulator